eukprot:2749645-Rhodomonas_salina.1
MVKPEHPMIASWQHAMVRSCALIPSEYEPVSDKTQVQLPPHKSTDSDKAAPAGCREAGCLSHGTRQNQTPAAALSVQCVPGLQLIAFDFAVWRGRGHVGDRFLSAHSGGRQGHVVPAV